MFSIHSQGRVIAASNLLDSRYVVGSATCTNEVNKAGSLEFVMYPNHPLFNELPKMKTIVQADSEGQVIFRGRILNSETDIYNQRTVYCEGDLAFLLDTIQEPGEYEETISQFLIRLIESHNAQVDMARGFKIGTINVGGDEVRTFTIDSYSTTWDVIQTLLISEFGGYLRTHVDDLYSYIDYMENYNKKASQTLSFASNIVDLTEYIPGEDFFTVLLPLGNDGTTIEEVNDGNIYLEKQELVSEYGRIVKIETFNNVADASDLLERAKSYFDENSEFPYTFKATAVDLSLIDETIPFAVGDTIQILSAPHKIDRDLVCKKITYNLLYPERSIYELGKKIDDFSEKYTSGSRVTNGKIQDVKNETENSKNELSDSLKEIKDQLEELKKDQSGDVDNLIDAINKILNGTTKASLLNTDRILVKGLEGVWKQITYSGSDGVDHTENVLVGIEFKP